MKKTNNNITELVFILDRSGSMGGLESDTIGGFNALLNKQKKQDGVAYVSTILFDHESFVLHDRLPIDKVEPLTDKDYTVRGCTALLDALGDAIHHIGNIHKYARPEDVPAQTMFVIITDGMENASRHFDYPHVKRLIEAHEEQGWEFIFLGANIDAAAEASRIGIRADHATQYMSDDIGTAVAYEAMAVAQMSKRATGAVAAGWNAAPQADVKKRGGFKFW